MNKKFSTLLAGMALLSAMSVNAQVQPGVVIPVESGVTNIPRLAEMASLQGKKLKLGVNEELYQLQVKYGPSQAQTGVLAMDEDGKLYVADPTTLDATGMANTLWCVTVSAQENGQAPKFDFENRATGMILDIATNNITAVGTPVDAIVGGDVSGWAFSRSYESLEAGKALFSYISAEEILGIKVADNGAVQVAKVKANEYNRDENKYSTINNYFSEFSLYSPAEFYLTATELNTIFGTYDDEKHGIKLGFDKDVLGTDIPNPFNAQSFYATQASWASGTLADDGAGNTPAVSRVPYLNVRQKDKEAYLRVDTAYTNEKGVPFLAYKWVSEWKDVNSTSTSNTEVEYDDASQYLMRSNLKNQYKFLFVYTPKNDNLKIYIHTVTNKDINDADAYWYSTTTKGSNWRVSLQDLIANQTRILTVDEKQQNTTITLGYKSCGAVTPTRTSLADGVYFIQNSKGQYLASPIHKNGDIEWVTVNDKQDVNHMPAFQWVVLKTNPADKNNVSSIQIWNREFATKGVNSAASIQLNTPADKDYYYVTKDVIVDGSTKLIANDKLTIKEVEAKYQSDKYLGYKKIAKNDLLVNKYTFNYYHPYSSNKFIAQSEKDSVLTVLDGKDAFVLDTVQYNRATGADEAYGYVIPSKDIQKRLPNLVQLYRTVYTAMKGDLNWAINKEDKFNVSKYFGATAEGNTKATPFFFKENNCIDGVHYYAILSTQWDSNKKVYTIVERDNDKAGVSDYDGNATLKAQILSETRTSAFAIAPDNSPLYRRFNNVALGESATDAADSLVFVEKYRKEYLMDEMNHSFMDKDNEVDYLGIWSKEHAKGNLAMRIDTAWLNRGAGNVKPQYLISVARDDQGAIETIPCDEADDKHFYIDEKGNAHKTDKWNCQHAKQGRAGFAYGKYLVSFADSARMEDSQKQPWMDIVNGYTRVGFVKAVHAGDSLFILVNEFKNMKPADLDTAEIVKAYKAAKINTQYIVNLQGDQHKNVTWSFRYVNPENAGKVTEEGDDNAFMFESNVYTDSQTSTPSVDYAEGAEKNIPLGNVHAKLNNAIAPMYAAWLKMQNGCLVLTRYDSDFNSSKTGGDAALVFNVAQKTDEDGMVTSNDEVSVEGVSVVSGNGAVTVQGAAGKSVVITNILGKVVAETILTSDNATIFVPAGIVAVAVDGEEAVKVVVK